MIVFRWLNACLLLALVGSFAFPAHAQFGSGFGGDSTPTPTPVVQTPAQMAQDFRAIGFVVPRKRWAYRNVEVALLGQFRFNRPIVVQTRGWVLPSPKGAPLQFVAWNGWIYRAKSVGEKANWRTDAQGLIERATRDYPLERPYQGFVSGAPARWQWEGDASDDLVSLSFDALSPLKAVMLQSLGEAPLAARAIAIFRKYKRAHTFLGGGFGTINKPAPDDGALVRWEFANDWISPGMNRVDRAIIAGDDATALETLRVLKRGLNAMDGRRLNQGLIAQLLRDWTRRAGDTAPADKNSVAFVIWDLQNIGLADDMERSGNWSGKEARLERAIAYGDRAVEPLLDAVQNDRRFTRDISRMSGSFSGSGPRPKIYGKVQEVAFSALEQILQTSYSDDLWKNEASIRDAQQKAHPRDSPIDYEDVRAQARRQMADVMRADWEKWRVVPARERPYLILQDDGAGAGKWRNAARALLRPAENGTDFRYWNISSPFLSEVLRDKRSPSVSELLVRRSTQLAALDPSAKDEWPDNAHAQEAAQNKEIAAELALVLHFWEPAAAPELLLERLREQGTNGLARDLLDAAPREQGRAIYAASLRAQTRSGEDYGVDQFRPLWRNLDDPFCQKVAGALFSDPNSPWNRVVDAKSPIRVQSGLSGNPLLAVPAWNAVVRRDLGDTRVVGTVKWDAHSLSVQSESGSSWGSGSPDRSPGAPPVREMPLRVCDVVAYALSSELSRSVAAPQFSLVAPMSQRDTQIQALLVWVEAQSGNRAFVARF